MTNTFISNRQFKLSSLLYEYRRGKTIWETFKNYCEVIGDDAMDYKDFEYWFMRFESGNFDLRKKSMGRRSDVEFKDLPLDIYCEIAKNASWKDLISLRQVSKALRSTVNCIHLNYKEATIELKGLAAILTIDGCPIMYKSEKFDPFASFGEIIRKLVQDLKSLSHHPKLLIEHLHIQNGLASWRVDGEEMKPVDSFFGQSIDGWEEFENFLNPPLSFLPVKSVRIGNSILLSDTFLNMLISGTLEEIEFEQMAMRPEILFMPQYAEAKVLRMKKVDNDSWLTARFDQYTEIDGNVGTISYDDLWKLKENALKSEKIRKWRVKYEEQQEEDDVELFNEEMERFRCEEEDDPEDPDKRIYKIEKNGTIIRITLQSREILLEKI